MSVGSIFTPVVRQWLYNISLIAVPLLVAYGIIDGEKAALWVAFGGAILGHGTAAVTLASQRRSARDA